MAHVEEGFTESAHSRESGGVDDDGPRRVRVAHVSLRAQLVVLHDGGFNLSRHRSRRRRGDFERGWGE